MICPSCNQDTEERSDNRGHTRCTACWAIIPEEVIAKAKEAAAAKVKPKRSPRRKTAK